MGFLRITQSLLDFACECNKIKKQLNNLKNMNMTKEQLIEYLERTRSTLDSDLTQILDGVTLNTQNLSKIERSYVLDRLNQVLADGEILIADIESLSKQLCK